MDRLEPGRHADGPVGEGLDLSRYGYPREGGCLTIPARFSAVDSRFRGSTLDCAMDFTVSIAVYNDSTLFGLRQPLEPQS